MGEYPAVMICKTLEISRSTLYLKKNEKKIIEDTELALRMIEIRKKNHKYGFRRIFIKLKKNKVDIGKKRAYRVYTENNLQLKRKSRKRNWEPVIESIYIEEKLGINIVKDIKEKYPFKVIRSDFTELKTRFGKYYFIAYLDDFSKKILSWNIGKGPDSETVLKPLKKALRYADNQSYFHQDQGSCFKSNLIISELIKKDVFISFSEKGTPTDNGSMESFFGRFKDEWKQKYSLCKNFNELYKLINSAIHYYNTQRIHTTIKDTPDNFLNMNQIQKKVSSETGA